MARIRTVKPEFWSHPVMGRLDDASKCMALALLNFADDGGYFLADPNLVRSSCRPFDDDSSITRRCLDILVKSEWIEVKIHPTHGPIGVIVNFTEHQKIDRPKSSQISTYFFDDESTNERRIFAAGMEGNGREWKGAIPVSAPKPKKERRLPWKEKYDSDVVEATQSIMAIWPDSSKSQPKKGETVPASKGPEVAIRLSEIKAQGGDVGICVEIARRFVDEFNHGGMWAKAAENFFGRSDAAPWHGYYKAHMTNQEAINATS